MLEFLSLGSHSSKRLGAFLVGTLSTTKSLENSPTRADAFSGTQCSVGGARHLSDKRCAHSVHVGECAHRSAALSGQIPQPGTEPQICSRHSAVPASCQKWQLSNLWHHLRPFQRLKMISGSVSISQVRSFMLAARI